MATSSVDRLRADEQPVAEYRSLARLAVVALGLGIASSLVLVTPLLAPLPVAGIVSAIAALRSIRASRGELTGTALAIAGLSLATFFLSMGLSRHLGRQAMLQQRAREMGDVFLNLLMEGRTREAHQFRRPPSMRIMSPEAIQEHYEQNKEAAQELQSFSSSPGVKELVLRGRDADVRFENVHTATRDGQSDTLTLRYSFIPAAGADRKTLWMHINRRYDDGSKRHQWEVGGVSDLAPAGVTE
jgi:hypothetical protein